jgi:hypothetical protein
MLRLGEHREAMDRHHPGTRGASAPAMRDRLAMPADEHQAETRTRAWPNTTVLDLIDDAGAHLVPDHKE